jgi:DNA-directed RNA polymerase III subunit RPC4
VTLLPVRIGRKEHVERTVAINTDASSEAAAKILQQAEATGGEIKVEDGELVPKKGKGKAKDLEITGVRRPYKGMWQEEEDTGVAVKSEPLSDDETMPGAEPIGNTDLTEPTTDVATLKKEPRIRVRDSKGKTPILQTEEEKQEYERTNLFRTAVRFELGPDGELTVEPRTESTYIFQLPPMMPKAADTGDIKKEEEEMKTPGPADTKDGKKKKKAKALFDPLKTTTQGKELGEVLVGKIRVHESGRTTLLWGDKVFELIASNPTDSVGEVVETERIQPDQRVVPEDHGEGSDMGRVKGRFVALPNWRAML